MSPQRFTKKPVTIEAMLNRGYMTDAVQFITVEFSMDDDGNVFIPTLEGEMRADVGDWIIRGVQGEFYPCKPDIFDATYEPPAEPESETP
jgi:hypothetical protein